MTNLDLDTPDLESLERLAQREVRNLYNGKWVQGVSISGRDLLWFIETIREQSDELEDKSDTIRNLESKVESVRGISKNLHNIYESESVPGYEVSDEVYHGDDIADLLDRALEE